jgi:acetyl esterase/lipase
MLVRALLFVSFSALPLLAGEGALRLWAGDAPGALGKAAGDVPEITVHLAPAEKATGAAVVICPGGGYGGLMMSYEGHDVAKWLNGHGVAGVVLKYRVSPNRHPAPLLDAQRAIRTVRSRAKEWKLDAAKIGIMGFSAGGHVASTAGTHFDAGKADAADLIERESSRPDFMILVYPVISMGPKGHGGSRANLLGKEPSAELIELLSNEKQVTDQTPPAFVVHPTNDRVVPVDNARMFVEAMKAKNVPVEYLETPTGDHGMGVGKGALWTEWQAAAVKWMAGRGILK